MKEQEIISILEKIALEYPEELVEPQLADIPRIAFNIALSLPMKALSQSVICDVGGGVGLFSLGCAAIGFHKVVLVDDFADEVNSQIGPSILDLHRRYGVQVVSRDVIVEGLKDLDEAFDVVTSFDSVEHWHHSPKRVLHEALTIMNPGGRFVLGVPNCVNLRKRLTVPFGRGKWSAMEYWYECETFRGHVREPDVEDLFYIAKDLKLENIRVLGHNWLGSDGLSSLAAKILGPFLRLWPSLCSNIYLVGNKTNGLNT